MSALLRKKIHSQLISVTYILAFVFSLPSQAKIPCSGMCRCVGCKNVPDKPESKSLMHLADAAGIGQQTHNLSTNTTFPHL